ncbi:dachshund homolog 2 isoform X7 [Monodelphis domestica]|uniref:dachshund homolog 2 isoform X7 n=1 Tax=Monodelphis domestica TaxID=13616 RepID=UPI0024E237CA|nr:dachshund homolog 2 isoform X7 [Monodelphis domestica]
MAVSAPPVNSATASGSSSNAGAPGGLFRAEPLYSTSPSESPRLTTSMINSFITTPGSVSGMSGGGGMSGMGSGSLSGMGAGMSGMSGGGISVMGGGGMSVMSGGGMGMSGMSGGGGGGGMSVSGGGGNECKMVDLHGVKVASFLVEGQELICLPQVFDLFLKHLVGGLHTVYTKLKRLDITPVVCTVEQVRILRGLGAIQPGVNRCKLITRKDFETLYNDCTNASSRPGRPPKRSLGVAIQENARLLPHGVPGLISPGLISPTGGSESSWDKEKMQSPMTPGTQPGVGHATLPGQASLGSAHPLNPLQQNHLLTNRLDLPFMMMPHPLLPVTLPPASVAMAMNQMNHLNTIANMAAAAQMHSPLTRAEASVIKERIQDSPSPAPSLDEGLRPVSLESSHHSSSMSSSPSHMDHIPDRFVMMSANREGEFTEQDNGSNPKKHQKEKVLSFNQELFDGSQSLWGGKRIVRQGAGPQDAYNQVWAPRRTEDVQMAIPMMKPGLEKAQLAGQAMPAGFSSPFIFADSLSSVETLLTNIQGLLKVALDNARIQEKQMQQEKKELRMELFRERELRETLERQLAVELQSRGESATIQKRLKKEKKAKRKLQEALEFESKRREQVEQALKQASTDAAVPDREMENGTQPDNAATMQASWKRWRLLKEKGSYCPHEEAAESQVYIKPPVMY